MERLLLAILRRVELDLGSRNREVREAARKWLEDPAGNMGWICEMLGFDPSEVRKRLLGVYRKGKG